MLLAIWDHHMVTCYLTQANAPHPRSLTPASEGWYSIYLPLEGWKVELTRCPDDPQPGVEPTAARAARSEVGRPNRCTTKTPCPLVWSLTKFTLMHRNMLVPQSITMHIMWPNFNQSHLHISLCSKVNRLMLIILCDRLSRSRIRLKFLCSSIGRDSRPKWQSKQW